MVKIMNNGMLVAWIGVPLMMGGICFGAMKLENILDNNYEKKTHTSCNTQINGDSLLINGDSLLNNAEKNNENYNALSPLENPSINPAYDSWAW
jgi:hypothetical protein